MWRTKKERTKSALGRLEMAREIWGWVPHPAQKRLFCSPAQMRVAACGRRWGKTECLSVDVATLAVAEARAGRECRQLVVAPTDAQARLLGAEVLRRIGNAFDKKTDWTAGLTWERRREPALEVTVVGASGVRCPVLCRTAARDGASLRGLWAHRIVVDEAARVPDDVLADVLLPMLLDKGGDYLLASSPNGRGSAFFRLWARGASSVKGAVGVASFQCPTSDNPHNNRAFFESMRDELGETRYRQEIDAEFVDDFGAVFREDDIAGGLCADDRVWPQDGGLRSDPSPDRIYSVGIDWGRKVDFSVVCVLDATDAPARLVQMQRWQGTAWEVQLALVAQTVADFSPWRVVADGTSIGDPLAEFLTAAIRQAQSERGAPDARPITVERYAFGPESKRSLIDGLTLALSGHRLCYPPHRALLAEMRGFEYGAAGPSGRATMAARGGGHDDIVMALALAWWGAPHAAGEPPASLVLLGSLLGTGR